MHDPFVLAARAVRAIVVVVAVTVTINGVGQLWLLWHEGWAGGVMSVCRVLVPMALPWLGVAALTSDLRGAQRTEQPHEE